MHAEEEMMHLGQSTLRPLEIAVLPNAMPVIVAPLHGCNCTIFEVYESWGRKWIRSCYSVALLGYFRGKRHSGVETWTTAVRTVYQGPDNGGGDSEPEMSED